ncbi:MAG: hypothetical protein ACP5JW_05995 [Candidatus Bathyarchaeia archaeon]
MKRVTVIIRQREINKLFPQAFQLTLKDEASVMDVIKAVDEEIRSRAGAFPVKDYESLLQMVYHPHEKRFYKQVAIHANVDSKPINVRENPAMQLPDGATVILIPENGCQTDWEKPV